MASPLPELQLAVLDVQPGAALESQSGLQMLRPRIYGAWRRPSGARVAAIVMHPSSNFMGHYLIAPLAARGVACMGLNSRYAGNDTLLLMERAIQDLGAGVQFLRAQGFDRVVLIGNSGGAALSACSSAACSASSSPASTPRPPASWPPRGSTSSLPRARAAAARCQPTPDGRRRRSASPASSSRPSSGAESTTSSSTPPAAARR